MLLLLLLWASARAALDARLLEACVRGDRTGDALLVTGRILQPRTMKRGNVTIQQPESRLWSKAGSKGSRGDIWAAIRATAKAQAASIKLESDVAEANKHWEAVNARAPGASVVVQVDGGNTAAHVVAGEDCSEAAKRFAQVFHLPGDAVPSVQAALEGARQSEVYAVARVADDAERALVANASRSCEGADWPPDALSAFLKLSAVAARARRSKVNTTVVQGSLHALSLLQASPLIAWALARRRSYQAFHVLKKATFENDIAPSEREAAKHAYERANVTGALRARDRAEQHVAVCFEKLKAARKGSDAVMPLVAQHKAREDALLATLAQTRRENDEADRSVRSHLRDTVRGLCDATLEKPHLRCDNEERKWLDAQLGLLGSAFLSSPEPFEHKAAISREDWEESVAALQTLEARFRALPRLARKETYAHKTLLAPFVYGKAHPPTSKVSTKERASLQLSLTTLGKDLTSSSIELRSKDNVVKDYARAVDALLRRAQTKASQYISRFGIVHWASMRWDQPTHELLVLNAFNGCRVKQEDPRVRRPANWTFMRVELMCPPWPALRYELKARVAELRHKYDASLDRLAVVRETWLPAAQKVENASLQADAGMRDGYARQRLDDLAQASSEIGSTANAVESDPLNNISTNASINTYGTLLENDGNGTKADAFKVSAQQLMATATDQLDADYKRAAELALLDAVVASRNTTAARRGALQSDAKGYALHRPSEEKLREVVAAENLLRTAQTALDKAGEVLEEALANAAAVQVTGPSEMHDVAALQQEFEAAVIDDKEARALLQALDPSNTMASSAFRAKEAADQLVLSLNHRVERDAVDAVSQARRLSEQLREPGRKPSLACPTELVGSGVEARLVRVDSVIVLPPASPGGEARWVAHVPCSTGFAHRAWLGLAPGFAMGLAVLHGQAHVAFGEAEGGALWPGKPSDFSRAEGAWLQKRTRDPAPASAAPELAAALVVNVNGREYGLDIFAGQDYRVAINKFCERHMGVGMCVPTLTQQFVEYGVGAEAEAARREAAMAAAEEAAARMVAAKAARVEAQRLEAARQQETARVEAERLETERLDAERVEAERVEAERTTATNRELIVSLPIMVGDREVLLQVFAGEDPMQKLVTFCGEYLSANAGDCVAQLTQHVVAAGGGAEPEPEPAPPPPPQAEITPKLLISFPIRVDDGREMRLEIFEGDDRMQKLSEFCTLYMGAGAASCVEQLTPHVSEAATVAEPEAEPAPPPQAEITEAPEVAQPSPETVQRLEQLAEAYDAGLIGQAAMERKREEILAGG